MEDNESHDREKGHERKGMSNKSSSLTDSTCKLQKEEGRGPTPISPLRMPDLPLPTPPPMANIMMTSRIGYRRILGNRGPEYRSPILGHRSHSMEFSSRSPSFYGNLPNAPILDSMRQDYYASRESVEAKPKGLERSQTLDCRRQVFRENRANTVEFASPMMARAYLGEREKFGAGKDRRLEAVGRQATLTDQLGLSPLPRHRNFENFNKRLEDFNEYPIYPHLYNVKSPDSKITAEHKSKYFSRDSVLPSEFEEVRTLNKELQRKYVLESAEENISRILGGSAANSETSPEYYSVFMNEHYISDIDENEEIKKFACGYRTPPERRYSDQTERNLQKSASTFSFYTYQPTTLPANFKKPKKCSKKPSKSCSKSQSSKLPRATSLQDNFSKPQPKKILKNTSISNLSDTKSLVTAAFTIASATIPSFSVHSHYSGSASSMKSSDYYSFMPVVTSSAKKVEFSGDSTGKVIKSPQRTVVKLAKIR